jgi:hypothetical protein
MAIAKKTKAPAKTSTKIAAKKGKTVKKAKAAKPAEVAPAAEAAPKEESVKKTRAPRKAKSAIKGFEEILKKQQELEAVTKKAKTELKKEYDRAIAEAEEIKTQYRGLFKEPIDSAVKERKPRAARKAAGGKATAAKGAIAPIAREEVEAFIEQKENGLAIDKIKIAGRRIKSVKRIDEAYASAEAKDADSVLELLK